MGKLSEFDIKEEKNALKLGLTLNFLSDAGGDDGFLQFIGLSFGWFDNPAF